MDVREVGDHSGWIVEIYVHRPWNIPPKIHTHTHNIPLFLHHVFQLLCLPLLLCHVNDPVARCGEAAGAVAFRHIKHWHKLAQRVIGFTWMSAPWRGTLCKHSTKAHGPLFITNTHKHTPGMDFRGEKALLGRDYRWWSEGCLCVCEYFAHVCRTTNRGRSELLFTPCGTQGASDSTGFWFKAAEREKGKRGFKGNPFVLLTSRLL